ncbi:hypothetical protein H8E77_42225 [bacterium]|nr:hypothetical protein [bacterium]
MKRIIIAAVLCLSIIGCGQMLENMSATNKPEVYDMDWYHKHNGYVIMTVTDTRNQPVMEVIAIPINSGAIRPLIHEEVEDVSLYLKKRLRQNHPVMYLTVYAHRDCIFFWPSLKLQQGAGYSVPTSTLPADSPLVAAAGRLFDKYGERRVREVDQRLGLFTNPYTGRDMSELEKEIELSQGETLSAVTIFTGGLQLEKPFYLICKGQRYNMREGAYTTREARKMMQIYALEE